MDLRTIDLAKYNRLHYSLRTKNGKANKCDFNKTCKGISTNYSWALKKGRSYSDDPNDYFQLCKSCHSKYDHKGGWAMSDKQKKQISERMLGNIPPNKGNDSRIDKVCKFCKTEYRAYIFKRKTYCSVKCRNMDMVGKIRNKNGRRGKNAA